MVYGGFIYDIGIEDNEERNCERGRPVDVREDVDDELTSGVPVGFEEDIIDVFEKGTKIGVGGEYLYNMLVLTEAWLGYKWENSEIKKKEKEKRYHESIQDKEKCLVIC